MRTPHVQLEEVRIETQKAKAEIAQTKIKRQKLIKASLRTQHLNEEETKK